MLERQINKIQYHLIAKYDTQALTNQQTCKELLFRGRELGIILYSDKLPSLKTKDVARYIVLHT